MEKKETNVKQNLTSAVSASVGTIAGVVVGGVAAQEVQAAEEVDLYPEPYEDPITVGPASDTGLSTPVTPVEPTPSIEVLSYETVPTPMGSPMDVAIVSIDDVPVILADIDRDGIADLMGVDYNGNGIIEDHEICDVSDSYINMQVLQSMAENPTPGGNDIYAQHTGLPDYVNDADVSSYVA